MIYFAFIRSCLFYGIEVYGNTTMKYLTKLITLNKTLDILKKILTRTHCTELYNIYCALPVNLLHNYQILAFIHQYVHHRSKLPPVFLIYLDENKTVHQY